MIRVVNDVGGQEMVVMGEAGRLDPSQFIWVDLSAICTSHNTVAQAKRRFRPQTTQESFFLTPFYSYCTVIRVR